METDLQWGFCKDCRWWQIEPKAKEARDVMGLCIEHSLAELRLRVSGNSGCNHFSAGESPHAKGSSTPPPIALSPKEKIGGII